MVVCVCGGRVCVYTLILNINMYQYNYTEVEIIPATIFKKVLFTKAGLLDFIHQLMRAVLVSLGWNKRMREWYLLSKGVAALMTGKLTWEKHLKPTTHRAERRKHHHVGSASQTLECTLFKNDLIQVYNLFRFCCIVEEPLFILHYPWGGCTLVNDRC